MLKDPLNRKKTAYELLKIKPDSRFGDTLRVYNKLRRDADKSTSMVMLLSKAKKLLSTKDRIAIDIFFYTMDNLDYQLDTSKMEAPRDIGEDLQELMKVPRLTPNELFDDLAKREFKSDYTPMKFDDPGVAENEDYYKIKELKLDIAFDK
jgi:hypothetical protein